MKVLLKRLAKLTSETQKKDDGELMD